MEVKKDDKILKPKKILEDLNYHDEGNIQDDVNGEVNLNNDEGNKNLLGNVKMDNLDKEDISLDYVKDEVPSDDDDSGNYNDVRGNDILYDDNLEESVEEVTDTNNEVFYFPLTCIMAEICSLEPFILLEIIIFHRETLHTGSKVANK